MKVVAIPGSLREASLNRRLLVELQRLAPDDVEIEIFDLGEIPLFDQDVEAEGDPEAVARLKQAIGDADAVVLACPEYNLSVTGVLKNAIDWASRPPGKSNLRGKPVALVGATPGRGATLRAQQVVKQSLAALRCWILPGHDIALPGAHRLFDDDGRLNDDKTVEVAERMLGALSDWTEKVRGIEV